MRRFAIAALVVLAPAAISAAAPEFDEYFTGGCLRVDLFHTGTAESEVYAVDEILKERFWGGNPRNLIDTLGLGGHMVRVFDLSTNRQIFSRGYCSLFGEWVTTDEAIEGTHRTFHETLLIPWPKRPVQVRIDRRDRENLFHTVFDLVVDPADYRIGTQRRYSLFRVVRLENNGDPSEKVDIAILADGYAAGEMHKLREDAERFTDALFDTKPYSSRRKDFNVYLVESFSKEPGIDDPRNGDYRDNLLGLSFDSFELDRYMLSMSNKVIRDVASLVPYDLVVILANTSKYGGGGIFNLYATSISDNEHDEYVFTHEFGHAFAGLGDEYYSSEVTYNEMYPRGIEPWEPNITALIDTTDIKWGDMIEEGTPVPTPADSVWAGRVGVFEGAGYSAEGLFRPYLDCRMKSKGMLDFCPVCRRAIEAMIDFHTR